VRYCSPYVVHTERTRLSTAEEHGSLDRSLRIGSLESSQLDHNRWNHLVTSSNPSGHVCRSWAEQEELADTSLTLNDARRVWTRTVH
jgi:hypothetical protein